MYDGFNWMVQELRSTEILQTDFVSNVSHELKTPLSAIEGYSMLLQDCDNLTPEQRGYVEKILFNTKRLSSLTGGILLLSKLENQATPTNLEWFSLDEQIRQTIVALESGWEKKNIELDVDLNPVSYYGNESLIGHVWSNILDNAIKFSPQEGRIAVRLWEENGTICVTVDDSGPGIRPDAMRYIFSKFYQADKSHKQEGNGLGLALVAQILKLEQGAVSVENLPECGCRFRIELKNKK
jgi:signal transduction histidine kinase